jgi:ferric-dicitrate binding protein FerR (iron transport regulator)
LVNNDRFIRWVKEPDDDTRTYWEAWLLTNPDKRELVESGRQIVSFLNFQTPAPSVQEFREVREKIKAQIREDELPEPAEPEEPAPPPAEEHHEPFSRYYQLAAVWIGILLVAMGTFLYFQTRHAVSYRTGYGEKRTVWLPDQSRVTLNANSSIRFYHNWSIARPREVWLKGEAFFDVRKTGDAPSSRLIVHAATVQVQVQGTRFNVHNRRGKVKVVLSEGNLKLQLQSVGSLPVQLRPGDMVEVAPGEKTIRRKRVKPSVYTMWQHHRLVFEETPLLEVAHTLEDCFGVEVRIETPGLARRRFTGSVPTQDLQALLTVLSESFGIRITRQADQILIQQ